MYESLISGFLVPRFGPNASVERGGEQKFKTGFS